MLAEAFCTSDDRVREAQTVLDEAQAERTRMLAAFAVTVGNDGAVADLMGLHEREVRVARRTVGKEDARTMASGLLTPSPGPDPDSAPGTEEQAAPEPVPGGVTLNDLLQQPHADVHVPRPRVEATEPTGPEPQPVAPHPVAHNPYATPAAPAQPYAAQQHAAQAYTTQAHAAHPSAAHPHAAHPHAAHPLTHQPFTAPERPEPTEPPGTRSPGPSAPRSEAAREAEAWSSSMDSVLVWSWQSGVDLQFVAEELGLDLRALLVRVQTLAAEGRLSLHAPPPPASSDTAGRHRRRQGSGQPEEYPYVTTPTDVLGPFTTPAYR